MDEYADFQGTESQYPDPEQSALIWPWPHQHQHGAPESEPFSPKLQASAYDTFASSQNESAAGPEHTLNPRYERTVSPPSHGPQSQSAVLGNLEEDSDFVESDRTTSCAENMSAHESDDLPSEIEERDARFDADGVPKNSRRSQRAITENPVRGPRSRGRAGKARGRSRGHRRGGAESRGRGGKGMKRGPRPPLEPSKEFAALQKEALDVFIDQHDYDKALNLIQQAISLNPEVYGAHALMSEIYFALGDVGRGVAALFSGAHAAPKDAGVWQQVADACLEKPSLEREKALQQAAYCFSRIVTLHPDDLDSRFQRAAINRELGLFTSALREFEKILAVIPHNPSVVQQVAEICLELGAVDKAKELYRECISHHQDHEPVEDNAFSWSDINVYVEIFRKEEEYEEGIASLKSLSRWLLGRRAETYWDEITQDDREWDPADEPRRSSVPQFAAGHHPPHSYGFGLPLELRTRLGIFRLALGPQYRSEALTHFEWLEPEDLEPGAKVFEYGDLFREVGHALKDAREYQEALRFLQPVKWINAFSDAEFWLAIAACSYVCGQLEQATECYEAAKASDGTCAEARTQLAKIYKDKGQREDALRNAKEALEIGRRAVIQPLRRKYERREAREAREAAERDLRDTHRLPIPTIASMAARLKPLKVQDGQNTHQWTSGNPPSDRQWMYGDRATKRRKMEQMSAEERENHRTSNVQSLYARMKEMTPAMRSGDAVARNSWLECADGLVHDFRSNRLFYPAERHVRFEGFDADSKRRASRKQWVKGQDADYEAESPNPPTIGGSVAPEESPIPTEYRGISFEIWLDIFLEQALTLAKLGEASRRQSYETIGAVLDCTIWYHQPEAMLKTYFCYLTCALALNDGDKLCNVVSRWFMREHHSRADSYRLFSALNLLYSGSSTHGAELSPKDQPFRHSAVQKFLSRQMRATGPTRPDEDDEDAVEMSISRRPVNEESQMSQNQQSIERVPPKETDIVLPSLYAATLYSCNSFPNALHYLYRAYALDPKNPMLLLHMALCFVHENFKRQNENKHYYIMQGLTFLQQYAKARITEAEGQGQQAILQAHTEIEFNRARIWNMLNLNNLAADGYGRVLARAADGASTAGPGYTASDAGASLSREAAYALQTAYALSGNVTMAKHITEQWLVI